MALKIRFRFDGRCSVHPRYNPDKDGRPQHKDCPGCESLWVIHLYTGIARRKGESGDGIIASRPEGHIESNGILPNAGESPVPVPDPKQDPEAQDHDTSACD